MKLICFNLKGLLTPMKVNNKKAFQLNTNRPLSESTGCILSKAEYVRGLGPVGRGAGPGSCGGGGGGVCRAGTLHRDPPVQTHRQE